MNDIKSSTRVTRFVIIGTLNALITALVIWIMMDLMDMGLFVSNVAAYVIAQTNNFLWSKYWVFTSSAGKFRHEIPLFLISMGCAYCAQLALVFILVERFYFNAYLAQFLGLILYGFVNYTLNNKLTFTGGQRNCQDNE
jgi:putative flippase GtrA